MEPSEKFFRNEINGKKVEYIVPNASGKMVFKNGYFDLITCLGVLHHVPNVSYILKEFFRVLNEGGVLLVREPIVSMHAFEGIDRKGMTKRERGLPLYPFRNAILNAGFKIKKESIHGFAPISYVNASIKYSSFVMALDIFACKMFKWNYTYDDYSFFKRFRPTEVSYVLTK